MVKFATDKDGIAFETDSVGGRTLDYFVLSSSLAAVFSSVWRAAVSLLRPHWLVGFHLLTKPRSYLLTKQIKPKPFPVELAKGQTRCAQPGPEGGSLAAAVWTQLFEAGSCTE